MKVNSLRPTLTDGLVTLRAPGPKDVDARFRLGNTPEIVHMFGADQSSVSPITAAQAENWVRAREEDPLCWLIDYDNRMIGDARIHTLVQHDRRASLALGILDPDLLGQGIGTIVLRLLVRQAFDGMGLHRLSVRVLAYNSRAIAAYRKVGFKHEGTERQAARVGENWHDDLIMGLLAGELIDEGAA